MGSKKYSEIYCDGGVKEDKNLWTFAFIVVKKNKEIFSHTGWNPCSGGFDVELAESEAIYRACQWASEHKDNYVLYTDSQAVLDKVFNKVPNATKNPHIKGVQSIMESFRLSQQPISLELKYKRRLSNEWMRKVHDANG